MNDGSPLDVHRLHPGMDVILMHPRNGFPGDQRSVAEHLKVGQVYRVERFHVGAWHTTLWLEGVPGIGFNSVHFEEKRGTASTSPPAEQPKPAPTPVRPVPDLVTALAKALFEAAADGSATASPLMDEEAMNLAVPLAEALDGYVWTQVHLRQAPAEKERDEAQGRCMRLTEERDEARRRYDALLADTLRLLAFLRYDEHALSDYPVLADALKAEEGR